MKANKDRIDKDVLIFVGFSNWGPFWVFDDRVKESKNNWFKNHFAGNIKRGTEAIEIFEYCFKEEEWSSEPHVLFSRHFRCRKDVLLVQTMGCVMESWWYFLRGRMESNAEKYYFGIKDLLREINGKLPRRNFLSVGIMSFPCNILWLPVSLWMLKYELLGLWENKN